MSFLFPGFLFASLAIAIPILIHLFNFRKFKKVYFSNVRFLKQIEIQTSSKQNLKNLLILAARILFIIFLVMTFAKPYIPARDQPAAFQRQVISVFIDNSFSMETVNKEGTLLDEAKRRAKEIALTYDKNDKFQVLTNDFEGHHQRLLSYEDFITALEEITISGVNRTLPQIIRRQEDVFSTEPNSKKNIYVISDFQKNFLGKESISVDSSTSVGLIRVTANKLPNVSVDSVWFLSPIHKPGDTEKLIVQLRNNSDNAARNIPIKLLINNQQKAISSLSLESRAVLSDTLSFNGIGGGWQQGEIQITDYPIVFDDKFYFSFNVKQSLPILAINERGTNSYLQAIYRSDHFFALDNTLVGNINYSGLGSYSLIVLNEVNSISSGLSQELNNYVKKGGNLLIFPSLGDNIEPLKNLLQTLGTDVPEQVVTQEAKVTGMNIQHPLFGGVFELVPQKPDLPVAKKYMKYSNQSQTTKQAILEFPGNGSFFSQYRLGEGTIYLSAVPLNEDASNFVRHSIFVPIMYQSALLSLHDSRLFYTLGRDRLMEINKIALAPNQTLKLRKGNFEAIPDVQQNENNSRVFVADQIREQGNFQLLKGDSTIARVAFNDDRSESDLSYADDDALHTKFPNHKVAVFSPGSSSLQNDIRAVNFGIQLWKLFLILALIFLAAEILIIRFYKVQHTNLVSSQ